MTDYDNRPGPVTPTVEDWRPLTLVNRIKQKVLGDAYYGPADFRMLDAGTGRSYSRYEWWQWRAYGIRPVGRVLTDVEWVHLSLFETQKIKERKGSNQ